MNPATKAAAIEALELCSGYVNAYGPDEARDKVRIALSALRSEPEPTPEPGERELFEAWYEADSFPAEADWFRREIEDHDEYYYANTHTAWKAWQAARASKGTR